MCSPPQNAHVEIVTPNVMVIEVGTLGGNEVMRVGTLGMGSLLLLLLLRTQREGQEESPH